MSNFNALIPNAQFNRGSDAYMQNGTKVTNNNPRYENGKFNKGIMIEERTVNLMPYPDITNLSNLYNNGNGTILTTGLASFLQGGVYFNNNASTISCYELYAVTANTTYTISAYVRMDDGSTPVPSTNISLGDFCFVVGTTIQNQSNLIVIDLGGGLYRCSSTFTTNATPQVYNGIVRYDTQSRKGFKVGGLQLEQKRYATSYIVGTRNAEVLTIPTWGISPLKGTWEQWVYVNNAIKEQTTIHGLFDIPRNNGIDAIALYHSGTFWALKNSADDGTFDYHNISDSITLNGWHLFTITWNSTDIKLYIDSVLKITVSNPKLTSAFGSLTTIGNVTGNYCSNTVNDQIRISNVVRSDAEILAYYNATSPVTHDDKTVILLNFDDDILANKAIKAVLTPSGSLHIRGKKQIG